MRTVTVNVREILDLVTCADTYGFNRPVLMAALREFAGEITQEDIDDFINSHGPEFTDEDRETFRETIKEWLDKYQP